MFGNNIQNFADSQEMLNPWYSLFSFLIFSYGVYVSQLIRYARTCSNYQDFMERGKVLTQKLLSQGYQKTKLVATLKKFYGRHHDLVNPYNVAVSRIVSDVFASDAP